MCFDNLGKNALFLSIGCNSYLTAENCPRI